MPISTGTETIGKEKVKLTVTSGNLSSGGTETYSTSKGNVTVGVERIGGEDKVLVVGSPEAVNEATRHRHSSSRNSAPVGAYDLEKGQSRQATVIEQAVIKQQSNQPVSSVYREAPLVDNNYLGQNIGKKEVIFFQTDDAGNDRQVFKMNYESKQPPNPKSQGPMQSDIQGSIGPAPSRSRWSHIAEVLDTSAASIISRGNSQNMAEVKAYAQNVLPILKFNKQGLKETGGILLEEYGQFRKGSAWVMNNAIQLNVGTTKNEFKSIPQIMRDYGSNQRAKWDASRSELIPQGFDSSPNPFPNEIGNNTSYKSFGEKELVGSHNIGMFNGFKNFFNQDIKKPVKEIYYASTGVAASIGAELFEQPVEAYGIFKGISMIGKAGATVGNFFGPGVGGFASSAAKYGTIGLMGLNARNQITDSAEKSYFTQGFVGSIVGFEALGVGGRYLKNKIAIPAQKTFNPGFVEDPGIALKPVHTDPIAPDALIRDFGGTRQTTVHVTENPAINFKNGDLLLRGFPEEAQGFRKNIDSLNFYRSLPESPGVLTDLKMSSVVKGSPEGLNFNYGKPGAFLEGAELIPGGVRYAEGKPQAYLAYLSDVNPTDYPSSQISDQFRFFKPRRQLLVEDVDVNYVQRLPGETPLAYNQRTNQMTGMSMIPAENIYGMSMERQVTTPSSFTGVAGNEYPGSQLRFIEDGGFTYYEQPRSLGWPLNKVGPLERAYQNTAFGKDFLRLDITRVKTLPVEDFAAFDSFSAAEMPEINMAEYNRSYGRTRYVGPRDLVSDSLKGSASRAPMPFSESFSPSMSESMSPFNSFSYSTSESFSPSFSMSRSRSMSESESFSASFSGSPSPSMSFSLSPSLSRSGSPSMSPSFSELPSEPFIPFINSQDDVFQVKKPKKNNSFGNELGYDPSLIGVDLGIKKSKKNGPLFGFEIRGL